MGRVRARGDKLGREGNVGLGLRCRRYIVANGILFGK